MANHAYGLSDKDSLNVYYNSKIADLRKQLTGLIIENESLDSLMDITQSVIAADFVPDSITQVQNDTAKRGSAMVEDAAMVTDTAMRDAIKENAAADTSDLVLVYPVPLADSLTIRSGNKGVINSNSKEVSESNTTVVPLVHKTMQDTVSLNKPAAKEEAVLLRERNSTLEDSLGNNAVTGKSKINVLTATRTDQVSPPSTDTPEYKAYAGKASKQQPTTSGNDEVARLRSELAGLQKEKESLMRQLDNTATTPVSVPDNPGRASGNDNAATQEDINSLKSEIQSLKGAIKENSNNQVVAPKRSFFPAIVPSIGVGVGKTKVEQVVQHDTIFVERPSDTASHVDTVRVTDTVRIRDTVRVSDTVKQIVRDTVQQAVVKDTVITVINTAAKQKESLLALPPFIILFDIGKSDVKLVYRKRLDYYASQLIQHQDLKVVITGHTDKTGSVANNLILSEKRAKSISGYLVGKGVSSDAMQLDKLGEAAPIAENNTKEGQSQNRRVELIFREK